MSNHAEDHHQHVVPLTIYFAVLGALMVGTIITVWIAFVDLGPFNTVVALAIAIAKATLVVLYFMHVRYSTPLTWLAVCGGIVWLTIMIAFTVVDFAARGWL